MKKTLNTRMIAGLKPAPMGRRYDVADSVVPGFAVRVTDSGVKSFVLISRMPGASHPTRRTIARVGAMDLQKAREVARRWLQKIAAGIDPSVADALEVGAAAEVAKNAFDAVMETYVESRLGAQKKKTEIARALRREFGGRIDGVPVGPWAGRPIRSIKTADVADVICEKAKTAPTQARNNLSDLAKFFRWAVARGHVDFSPAAQIRPSDLLGKVTPRTRHLNDDELRRVWNAALQMEYPWGPIYLLLILTGCRLNEVADASWAEFDLRGKTWTIPAARMKGKLDHVIPLHPMLLDVLRRLPRWNGGPFMFSNTNGTSAVTVSNHIKGRMDVAARVYGWRNHDLRRTMRTHLSAIPEIPEHVRELMVAHKRKGIEATYDRFEYFNEKMAGFGAWHERLTGIVTVGQGNMRAA